MRVPDHHRVESFAGEDGKEEENFLLSVFAVVISDYPNLPSLDDDDLDVDDLSLSLDFIPLFPFTTLQNHSLSISLSLSLFLCLACPSLVDLCAPNRQTICCLKLKKVKGYDPFSFHSIHSNLGEFKFLKLAFFGALFVSAGGAAHHHLHNSIPS